MNLKRYGWNQRGGPTTRQAMREAKNPDTIDYPEMKRKMATCTNHEYKMDSWGCGDIVSVYYECIHCGKIVMGDSDPTETGVLKPGMELPL